MVCIVHIPQSNAIFSQGNYITFKSKGNLKKRVTALNISKLLHKMTVVQMFTHYKHNLSEDNAKFSYNVTTDI